MSPITQKHYKQIRNILIIILMLNWIVALAKILYGLYSHCVSITADGLHSLSDGASNIIGIIGIHFAAQPKDKDHPYGHKKYETFFALGIAVLLFLVAIDLIKEGILRLHNPVPPQVDIKSFIIMGSTLLVNFGVMRYENKQGKNLQSDILLSDSLHTKADILTSLSVILALIFIKLGFPILDPLISIIIAFFIAYAAMNIIKQSSRVLCDTVAMIDEKKITDIVLKIKGVKNCHKIRNRGRSDDIHLDLHVQVGPDMHMDEAHKISYEIEKKLLEGVPQITDVVVHMEPKEKEEGKNKD